VLTDPAERTRKAGQRSKNATAKNHANPKHSAAKILSSRLPQNHRHAGMQEQRGNAGPQGCRSDQQKYILQQSHRIKVSNLIASNKRPGLGEWPH
jgi:hypothetical protein